MIDVKRKTCEKDIHSLLSWFIAIYNAEKKDVKADSGMIIAYMHTQNIELQPLKEAKGIIIIYICRLSS